MAKEKNYKNYKGPKFCMFCNSEEHILRRAIRTTETQVEDDFTSDGHSNITRIKYVDIHGNQATNVHANIIYKSICESCWEKHKKSGTANVIGFCVTVAIGIALVILSYILFPNILWNNSEGTELMKSVSFWGFLARITVFCLPVFAFMLKIAIFFNQRLVGKEWHATYSAGGTPEYHQYIEENKLHYFYNYTIEES